MDLWKRWSKIRVAALPGGVMLVALIAPGCGPSSPTPPATPSANASDEPKTVGESAEPDEQPESPAPQPTVEEPVEPEPIVAPVEIPDGPVTGTIDGQVFTLAGASVHGSVVTLTGEGGRSVSVILFDQADGAVDLTGGEWPFGSPHVVLRPGGDDPATTWTDGYRLRLDLEAGELFIELPAGRGRVAGRFDTQ